VEGGQPESRVKEKGKKHETDWVDKKRRGKRRKANNVLVVKISTCAKG